jgi:hypothetical protein
MDFLISINLIELFKIIGERFLNLSKRRATNFTTLLPYFPNLRDRKVIRLRKADWLIVTKVSDSSNVL